MAVRDDALTLRRGAGRWIWLGLTLVAVAGLGWWMTHPRPLGYTDVPISATTPIQHPIYVGLNLDSQARSLDVSDVTVPIQEDPGRLSVEALACAGGSLSVTTDPEPFCESLSTAKGSTLHLGAGDQLVLKLDSAAPGPGSVGSPLVTYREGLQFATQPGGAPVSVTFLPRGEG